MKKIGIFGAGYVGLGNAVVLSRVCEVDIFEVDNKKIESINNGILPINEEYAFEFIEENNIRLNALNFYDANHKDYDLYILCLPTNFNEKTNEFDVSILERVLQQLNALKIKVPIVVKSTVPVGFTKRVSQQFKSIKVLFSPEFLREGSMVYDCLFPERILVSNNHSECKEVMHLFSSACQNKPKQYIFSDSECEAVKLFSNTYLAMRISYFNELDSFALTHSLDTGNIIKGLSADTRIGSGYNNPSFGYGGYCLPKDTRQLLSNFSNVPQRLIGAIVESNAVRKKFISEHIVEMDPDCVGIYRINMKSNSDNFRESASIDIIKNLIHKGMKVILFEPILESKEFLGCEVVNSFEKFLQKSDIILANRKDKKLMDVKNIIFTRDVFNDN